MAAVSIQLMPSSRARSMVVTDSLSSCAPQANSQLPPPIAQAPKPMAVRCRSEFPSVRVSKGVEAEVDVVVAIAGYFDAISRPIVSQADGGIGKRPLRL